jgi:hypothetical protein
LRALIVPFALGAVFARLSPAFLTTGNLTILVKHVAINAILAVGMTFVILSGGIGNRDFFPDVPVGEARRDLLKLFDEPQIDAVLLDEQAAKLGAVETWERAKHCADPITAVPKGGVSRSA